MSPKKTTHAAEGKPVKVAVFLPPRLHARCLKLADGRSLTSWIATQLARIAGMSKEYTPPRAGRPSGK